MSRTMFRLIYVLLVVLKGIALLAGVWWAWKAITLGLIPGHVGPYIGWGIPALMCLIVVVSKIDLEVKD
ncbi:hypothetical protein [Bifidobacterium felsineum]|uniref:hypothetical protein n=1 Tax=Bifidobacterium felsineum TaxID=2045440 RepID=UPI001BDDC334|nr:hypothetical protein [Bifidobacterium felsineum]MBT1164666.1 hypothetical protein [Bifidobacterium felsineum]